MTRRDVFTVLIAFISAGAYIAFSAMHGSVGFPLDDAWIHQVYARNLGINFEFSFFTGQPSAGSTSPLWSIFLAIGYLLCIDFRVWAYLLGVVLFVASAVIAARLSHRLITIYDLRFTISPILIPLFLLLEWHMAWSAASGMEILLFVFLSLILLERFYADERVWVVGLLGGLLVLTRPEGSVLVGLVALGFAWKILDADRSARGQTRNIFSPLRQSAFVRVLFIYGFSFSVILVPYLAFNLATVGTILPNTFYAKSAEYAVLFEQKNLIARWVELITTPFVGAQILLIPGLIYIVVALALKKQWLALIPFAWLIALPTLYAIRLPVSYQHGRYEMPIIPFIVIYGIWGTAELFKHLKSWVIRTAWGFSVAAVLVVFWFLGAAQYGTDVAIINCEMVGTAKWIAANASADAMVAAHDIGALGYYYNRPFIDLAGLATPEVIPFIRDEGRLRDFLFSRQATFVVVFPDWYSTLPSDPRFIPAYQTNCAVTRNAGEKNMIVYRLVQ